MSDIHPSWLISEAAGQIRCDTASSSFAVAIMYYTAALLARDRAEDLMQVATLAGELIERFRVVLEAEEILSQSDGD